VTLPGPGTVELVDRPSTLPPGRPPSNTTPGQPNASTSAAQTDTTAGKIKGQLIVYGYPERSIGVEPADGRGPKKILHTEPVGLGVAAWSPDGSSIAFNSERDGRREIYVMNADGTNQRRLTMSGGSSPSWSPDGRSIAFDNFFGLISESSGIYVMNSDGSNPRKIHNLGSWPRWSPDGTRIVFDDQHLFLMNSDGTDVVQLTTGNGREWVPEWSADSQQIAFQSGEPGSGFAVIDRDGNNRKVLERKFSGQNCSLWAKGGCGVTR
jgi:Tol biopolymer transport system component